MVFCMPSETVPTIIALSLPLALLFEVGLPVGAASPPSVKKVDKIFMQLFSGRYFLNSMNVVVIRCTRDGSFVLFSGKHHVLYLDEKLLLWD